MATGHASVEALLAAALKAGAFRCGEIHVTAVGPAGARLCHHADVGQPEHVLVRHERPEDAAEIARYTDAGIYRPLKTAPNLRRGWCLHVPSRGALRLVIDLIYPARLGALLAFEAGLLRLTSFRETLGRQSGMYRVTQKLTESQADALIGRFCRSDGGCLRTILWGRDQDGTPPSSALPISKYDPRVDQCGGEKSSLPFLPLLCQETCNLLVAEARRVVKGEVE